MLRRHFLLSVAASALTLLLPLPAVAALPTYVDHGIDIGKLELVEQALDAADMYGPDLERKTMLFGLEPSSVSDFSGLRNLVQKYVLEWGSRDVADRIWNLIRIRQCLDHLVGRDVAAHLRRLRDHDVTWHDSPWHMMHTGHFMDLRSAALSLDTHVS